MPNPERSGQKRMAGALASSLALHALVLVMPFWWFLHQGSNAAAGRLGNSGGGSGFTATFLAGALHGSDVLVLPPSVAEAAPDLAETVAEEPEVVLKETVPETTSETTPGSEPVAVQGGPTGSATGSSGSGQGPGTPGDGSDPNGTGTGQGGTGTDPTAAAEPPGEVAIRPREYVHPRIPEDVVRKRKISDFVLMQVLVGTDGKVRDVRVLRAIANCEECNQSAVDAAWRLRYDPVMVGGRATEVWTVPFDFKFSYQR